jgi:tripartite-type tricarboxylate transporter receptor subunit TctC
VRALGVTTPKRSSQLPEVPTFDEAGVKGYDVSGWYGLCTQAGVPGAVLAKIHNDANRLLAQPVLQKRLLDQGVELTPMSPEKFVDYVRIETEKWTRVIDKAGLKGDD